MKEYFYLILASLAGGAVTQVKQGIPMPFYARVAHALAGAICAVYLSPFVISYLRLGGEDTAYLVPFLIGSFWTLAYERVELLIKSLPLPTFKGKK